MEPALIVSPRHYRSASDHTRSRAIRIAGFTEWYVGPLRTRRDWLECRAANARARLYPEFYLEVRTDDGRLVAVLSTAPTYWSGHPQALHDLPYYDRALHWGWGKTPFVVATYVAAAELLRLPRLFDAALARFRHRKLDGANAIVLIGMAVDPEYRGRHVPSLLLEEVRRSAARLGLDHIVAPFRPNAYGAFKMGRRAAHDPALFEEYCSLRDASGLPRDPWLRVIARHGGRFVRTEPRSFSVEGSIARFEAFRAAHRAECWYSPAHDVWECGETPTWYVDRCRKRVLAVEPNVWGVLPVAR
jgi:GNAT superfamily N-acetyltransferase